MNIDDIGFIYKDNQENEYGLPELKLDNNLNHNCSYFETEDFIKKIGDRSENFSTLSLNIRSLNNKTEQLQDFLHEISTNNFNFSVCCLQEVWGVLDLQATNLENFHPMILKKRENQRGGGLGVFISQQFNFENLEHLNCIVDGQYEALFVKVFINDKDFKLICNFYRPPNGEIKQFTEFLANKLNLISNDPILKKANEIIICGDFNVNFMNFDVHSQTNDLLNLFISSGFIPMITLPSRITERSASLIDNIFTNKKQTFYESGLIFSSLSDHLPVFYTNLSNNLSKSKSKVFYRDMSQRNIDSFKDKLSLVNWSSITNEVNPQNAFDKFSENLDNAFTESFPLKEQNNNKRYIPKKPWMTQEILSTRKSRNKLFKDKFKKRTADATSKFDFVNKKYNSEIRKAKKDYFDQKFSEFSKDMKKTWSLINTLIKKKKGKNNVPSVFNDGQRSYSNFSEIAEGFNDFFVNVGPRLASSIPDASKTFDEYLNEPNELNFNFRNITEEIIYLTLSKLKSKSSVGKDNISMKLLKYVMPVIIKPILHLFNISLETGFIPESYKCAKVIPIHKSGASDKFDNYRPISILPALSKLLEKIVAFQMIRFLESQDILYTHQYGFRNNRDTIQPLIHLMHKVFEGLNKPTSEYTLSIFLDLRKAFDTCNIEIMLKKLHHYGFRDTPLKWFKNYLTGRKQYVEINGFKSKEKTTSHGVPQGSILGPILFLIYINDFPLATSLFSSLFADDTMLTKSSNNVKQLQDTSNLELNKVSTWFKANKLSLNISKTKYMIFRNEKMTKICNNFELFIDGTKLERVGKEFETKSFKFVGVHLDETLNWDYHINHVNSKLSSAIYAINQVKNILSSDTLKKIYNALFQPHIEYAIIIWGLSKNKDIESLRLKQKKAIRIVSKSTYNAHCDPLFSKLNLLKFDDILNFNVAGFVSKFHNNKLPTSFNEVFQSFNSQRVKNLKAKSPKMKSLNNFPTAAFPKIWNKFGLKIKNCNSFKLAKSKYKKSRVQSYSSFRCNKRKCYPCKK